MAPFLKPFSAQAYAAFRIVFGFLFLQHGLQKCFGLLGGSQAENTMMWIAGVLELVGGAAIMVGLFTRWSAFFCSGLMAAAYFIAHQSHGALPIQNRGEMAVLYCFAFLFIAAHGPGILSIDQTGRRD